jgi:DNA repair ATPase RecN
MAEFRYKIGRVKIRNIKGITDVEIDPVAIGDVIRIGGRNAAGKSSVLDAILYPIAGRRVDAAEVIRRGAVFAEVSIELDGRDGNRRRKYLVCRKWYRSDETAEIKSTVTVKAIFDPDSDNPNATGNIDSPQTFLNDLSGGIGIVDPHDFIRAFGPKQLSQLVDAFAPGESIVAIDDALAVAVEDRRTVRDRVRVLTATRDAFSSVSRADLKRDDPLPDLLRRQSDRDEYAAADAENDRDRYGIEHLQSERVTLETRIAAIADEIERAADRIRERSKSQQLDPVPRITVAEYSDALIVAESRGVWKQWRTALSIADDEIERVSSTSDALNQSVDDLRSDRVALLSAVDDVVPGLSIVDDGIYFRGSPLRDCSSAEQIRVGALLSIAVDPALRVLLIRDGSLMDEDSLQILRDIAINNDFQVWIEIVGPGADITIEGGRIK